MNKNILYLTLGGLVVLGVGIAIGSRINHHFAPRAYHCSDCGRFGDEFICSSCNKTIIDFRSLEQPFPPCNSPVYMPQLPRHHRDGMAPVRTIIRRNGKNARLSKFLAMKDQ